MSYYKNRPVLYVDIDLDDDVTGVDAVSFVDNPATEELWMTYSAVKQNYSIVSNEERLITAPVMIADTPIERYDDGLGYYYTVFTPEVIKKMQKKYFMKNKIHNINEMHDGYRVVDDVYMIESYIVGDKVESKLFPDLKPGSWVATYYVDNKTYWSAEIKSGNFRGISLEGRFRLSIDQLKYQSIENILKSDMDYDAKYDAIEKILKKSK